MKKLSAFLVVIAMCCLTACSCGGNNDIKETEAVNTTAQTETSTKSETSATTEKLTEENKKETQSNTNATGKPVTEIETRDITEPSTSKNGLEIYTEYYTITLPANWTDKYVYEVSPENKAYSLTLYHKKSKQTDFGGHLFTIALYDPADDYSTLPAYKTVDKIVTSGGQELEIVLLYPTDVQFDPDSASEYSALTEDINHIISTLHLTDKAEYK